MAVDSQQKSHPFWRIARTYFLSPRDLTLSSALIVFVGIANTVIPFLVGMAVDLIENVAIKKIETTPDQAFAQLVVICLEMLAVVGLVSLATYGVTRLQNRMIYRGAAKLRDDIFSRIQAQPAHFLTDRRMGEILSHLVGDVKSLQDALLDLVFELPFDATTVLGLLAVIFWLNPAIGAIFTTFMLIVALISLFLGRKGWSDQQSSMDDASKMMSNVHESLGGMRAIHAHGAVDRERERVSEASREQAEGLEEAGEVRAVIKPFFGFAEYTGIALVLLAGGYAWLHGSLTAGGLIMILAYMEIAAEPMVRGAQMLVKIQQASASSSRLAELLREIDATDQRGTLALETISGAVRAVDVTFNYPKGGRPALGGVNFNVAPGERIAVIGPNGAGKSTLLDLLLKLQTPSAGRIDIDGRNLSEVSGESWHRHTGVVLQDTQLLNRSIAENIALGSGPASLEKIREAALAAGVDKIVANMPKGLDSLPGERGAGLSGGERQRIAIARLFLRDPRIALLDEPTSALDLSAERELLPALEKLCKGRTTFIVSHRAAVLKNIDKVLLIADGKQLAFGTPMEVWGAFTQYRELFPAEWGSGQDKLTK